MLRLAYLWNNLHRKPLRTTLTIVAVAMPIFVYVLGMAIVRNVELFLEQSVKQMRLVVVQKSSIINPLPAAHRGRIQALDPSGREIVSVCGMRWFGGRVPDTQTENYFIAADVDSFPDTYPEFKMTAEQIERWRNDRRAAVVGRAPAKQYGWKEGQTITLEATVPPYLPMEMLIVAIPPDAIDSETSFMRYDYLNEALKQFNFMADRYSFIFVKCASRDDVIEYRNRIDAEFARTENETKTQDEKSFMETFIAAQFDLPTRLRLLSYVVVAVAIMAAANTMMMTFRDRVGEYAVFKALGFSSRFVSVMLVAESTLLALIGGVVGAGLPYLAFNYTAFRDWRVPQLGLIQIRTDLLLEGIAVTAIVGLAAALFPAARVANLKVVQAFRRIG
jgi:putative ABC transport system permease protein